MDEKKEEQLDNLDFLDGHEDLLNSINTPEAEEETPAVTPEPAPEAPVSEPEPTPEAEPEPELEEEPEAAEPAPEETIEAEQEAPVAEPEAEPMPEPEENPEKKQASAPKKKKPQPQADRTPEETKRHEEVLQHQALENSEVKEVLNVILKYAKPAIAVVIVVCAFVLINSFFKGNRVKKEAKADTALMQAHTAADYQAVLDDFGATPSAPLAMMGLAQEKFNAGQVDEAEALYGTFLKKYGKHEMAVQAEFNQITCKEGKGQLDDAQRLYGEFAQEHESSHLAPVALLSKARCLDHLSKFSEAKQAYEDLIAYYPETGWAQGAERKLKILQSKMK